MAGTNLESVKARAWQYLRDELSSSVTAHTFKEGEMDEYISRALVEVSEASPYEVIESGLTVSTAKEVTITTIRDTLIDVIKAEYKTGQNPKQFRNVSIFGNILTVDYDSTPTSGDTIYLYCLKLHELDRTSSTMTKTQEDALVLGAAVYAAQSFLNTIRTEISDAITKYTAAEADLTSMTARIEQAVTDIGSGRSSIGTVAITDPVREYPNLASREMQSATAYLNRAGGYLRDSAAQLSGSRTVAQYQTWINTQLGQYRDRLNRITVSRTWQEYSRA